MLQDLNWGHIHTFEEKERQNHQKGCDLVVTGLTGVNAASPFGWVTRHECPGDPVRLCMLQGDLTPMTG
jgi:hypothetical protein